MRSSFLLLLFLPFFFPAQENGIAFKTFTISPDLCRGLRAPSGSLIFIPANAFIMEDGSPCSGPVTVKYREFHSQTDMYYSGLNMLWEENGKYRILESVGMFEIQAWCGNQPLKLKEDKSVQVRMKTRRDLPQLFSFIYDKNKNTWSKYSSTVSDFSYFKDRNKADSINYWGGGRTASDGGAAMWDIEMDGERVLQSTVQKLPEGFF